jgi:hypothetical protein
MRQVTSSPSESGGMSIRKQWREMRAARASLRSTEDTDARQELLSDNGAKILALCRASLTGAPLADFRASVVALISRFGLLRPA